MMRTVGFIWAAVVLAALGASGCATDSPFESEYISREIHGDESFQSYIEFGMESFKGYEPWLQSFGDAVYENWRVPYAYRLGIISGYVVVHLVIAPSGEFSGMEVEDTVGHESLREASIACLDAIGSAGQLPRSSQGLGVAMTLTFWYPQWSGSAALEDLRRGAGPG